MLCRFVQKGGKSPEEKCCFAHSVEEVQQRLNDQIERADRARVRGLNESLTGTKIDMIEVQDNGTGWADDTGEMDFHDNEPLFNDMPPK